MKIKGLFIILLLPVLVFGFRLELAIPEEDGEITNSKYAKMMEPGHPELPYLPIRYLLPMGHKLSNIELAPVYSRDVKSGLDIPPAPHPQPISGVFVNDLSLDLTHYQQNDFYPEQDYKVLGIQRLKGYDLLVINLYPYKYNPVTGELRWWESVEIDLETEPVQQLREAQNLKLLETQKVYDQLAKLVINPGNISTYSREAGRSSRILPDPADPHQMIIITDEQREPYFAELIERRNSEGINTSVFLTSEIYANYPGENPAAQVRYFIIDAYQTYAATETPLEYILLGGDDEIVPIRGCYGQVGNTVDSFIPCDLYYSNLDGDWNANNNNIYGEPDDEVDMLPELAIGRIPAESELEFANFFAKTFFYEDNSVLSDEIAYMVGENLNYNPLTWGGDYKDEVAPSIDSNVHIFTLYDRDGTFSSQAVKNAIDNGTSVLNHMGHSNESMVFGQNLGMAHSYTNTEYGFAYSQGCYPAAFDELTSGQGESIAENLVFAQAGLFAFVGNTRYGWYSPGSTNGASQPFDVQFFEAIYEYDIRELGNALQFSREVLVNEALTHSVMRWVYYELVLFGDPTTGVKSPAGNYPMLQPVSYFFGDNLGDGDGVANPGETIDLYVTLQNLPGWSDADNVYCLLSSADPGIEILQDSVYFGYIPSGDSSVSTSFLVNVPQDCNYDEYVLDLEVFSVIDENNLFHKTYQVEFEVSLYQPAWPWSEASSVVSNPAILDFDEDGSRDILVINSLADIFLLDINAVQQPGFPWLNNENIWKSSALGDINGDQLTDVIIASRNGRIIAQDNSGEMIFIFEDCLEQLLTPIISDLNGDNIPEIISMGIDKKLLVLDNTGNLLPGFPVELSMVSSCDMASADIDGDGNNDIIIGTTDGKLHVIDYQGNYLPGYPIQLSGSICAAPTILENKIIITGTVNAKLYMITPTGSIDHTVDLDSRIANSVIAADFSGNGINEIAFVTMMGSIYLLDQNADFLPGWPLETMSQFSNPPLTADLNNDDELDLICISSLNQIYAYHKDGTEFDFSPVPTMLSGNTPSSIDDIDQDGDYDILSGYTTGAFIIDVKLPKGEALPWRTYRGNYRRTGYVGDNDLLDTGNNQVPKTHTILYQNYPNPFNPVTNISFSLSEPGKVELKIYNLKGQRIKTLADDQIFPSGLNTIQWQGDDDKGNKVSSGIYFYRFTNSGKTSVRKMLLLK